MTWKRAGAVRTRLWLLPGQVALSLCWLFCEAKPAEAQELQLSLQSAIQQALAGNAELSVSRAQADIARGQVTQAGLRPNPRFTVQTEDIRPGSNEAPFSFADSTEDYLLVGQTIETGGKRDDRVRVANASLGVAEAQHQLTRRQIVARVGAAYWNAVLTRRVRELANQSLQTYDEDVNYIGNRVREGIAAEADLVRLEIERERVRSAALTAARDSNQALMNLFKAMGKADFPAATLTTKLEDGKPRDIPLLEQALASRVEIQVARKSVEQAESDLKLQRALAKPDPEVFVGYKRNSGFDTAYAAVQVDLPIHNRNQGNIGSAQARVRLAQANLQVATTAVRADYEAAVRAFKDQQALVATLPALVAQAQESERLARGAYREGGLELLRLLDAERSRIQAQLDYARALADLQQSITTLEFASGVNTPEQAGK